MVIRLAIGVSAVLLAAGHAREVRADDGQDVALTLSGVPASPRAQRSLSAGDMPAGVRFQAPAAAALASAQLAWQRAGSECEVTLNPDVEGGPGDPIARQDLDPERGWSRVALASSLVEGATYHLLVDCPADSTARLAYAVDRQADAADGAWQFEDSRRGTLLARKAPASPVFVLTFTDGSAWGNPYNARDGGLRVCGSAEAWLDIVPATAMTIDGLAGPAASLAYSIEAPGGVVLLSGSGAAPAGELTLAAGATYSLRLRAPDGPCVVLPGLRASLPLGRPLVGIGTASAMQTVDGGRTWVRQPFTAVNAGLHLTKKRHPTTTTTSTTIPATTTSSTTTTTGTTIVPPSSTTSASTSTTRLTTTSRAPTTTTSTTATTTTAPQPTVYRAPYADGYIGLYDANTIPVWPKKMILMLGEAEAQGPLIANAKQVAASAGNTDARFIFYFSLTEMDSQCNCFDEYFYNGFKTTHPEWILHDANGNPVTTANGIGRLFASDIGNLAYVDAWVDRAFSATDRYGWDGVFADSVIRGNFSGWSGWPINPRTGQPYTSAQYRQDMLAALQRIRSRFDGRGKIIVGNHSSAWDPATFADPVVQAQVTTMHGVELEDCVYTFSGTRHTETNWIAQLRYLDYANQHGVRSICSGPDGTIGNTTDRWYILASYLLTKEGFSSVAEINTVGTWWEGLDYQLGAPLGRFYCLDPAAGLARTTSCPSTGKIYGRDWEHGRALVNPTSSTSVHVSLGATLLLRGTPVTAVDLAPGSGVVLVRP
jgi:putative glycosyl hydrolase-like family 15 (GHL15) protein